MSIREKRFPAVLAEAKELLEDLWGGQAREAVSPRERIELALAHRTPDRVPFDYFAVPELTRSLLAGFGLPDDEALLRLLGCDFRRHVAAADAAFDKAEGGTFFNIWGAHRKLVSNATSTYEEAAGYPLAEAVSASDVLNYHRLPEAGVWDWAGVRARVAVQEAAAGTEFYHRIHIGGIFETAWALTGLEKFLVDLAIEPEIPCTLLDRITAILIDCVHRVRDEIGPAVQMIATYDDVASQQAPLMSPQMWERYILPRHQRLNREISRCGYRIYYHCCGAVAELIPAFIEKMAIDMLDPLQPRASGMDLPLLKRKFGNRLSFHGGVDLQWTMPFGSPEDVGREVEELCRVLGKDGGYVCCGAHHLQADTPWQNVAALYCADRGSG